MIHYFILQVNLSPQQQQNKINKTYSYYLDPPRLNPANIVFMAFDLTLI